MAKVMKTSPAPGLRPVLPLAVTATALFVVEALLRLVLLRYDVQDARLVLNAGKAGRLLVDTPSTLPPLAPFVALTQMALAVVVVTTVHRAHRNLARLRLQTSMKGGWVIAGWFVPFANLILPRRAVRDVVDAGEALDGSRWGSRMVDVWWIAWLAFQLAEAAGPGLAAFAGATVGRPVLAADVTAAASIIALADLLAVVAAITGAVVFLRLGLRHALLIRPRGPFVDDGPLTVVRGLSPIGPLSQVVPVSLLAVALLLGSVSMATADTAADLLAAGVGPRGRGAVTGPELVDHPDATLVIDRGAEHFVIRPQDGGLRVTADGGTLSVTAAEHDTRLLLGLRTEGGQIVLGAHSVEIGGQDASFELAGHPCDGPATVRVRAVAYTAGGRLAEIALEVVAGCADGNAARATIAWTGHEPGDPVLNVEPLPVQRTSMAPTTTVTRPELGLTLTPEDGLEVEAGPRSLRFTLPTGEPGESAAVEIRLGADDRRWSTGVLPLVVSSEDAFGDRATVMFAPGFIPPCDEQRSTLDVREVAFNGDGYVTRLVVELGMTCRQLAPGANAFEMAAAVVYDSAG